MLRCGCSAPCRGLVSRAHVQDAVGVDVERHLDLGHSPRRGRDTVEMEPPDGPVAGGHVTLALKHMYLHRGLAVRSGGEHLALLRRDRGVPFDEPGEHASQCLDAEGQRGHVEQEHVAHLAESTPPWIAAPSATTSSGFTPLCGPCRTTRGQVPAHGGYGSNRPQGSPRPPEPWTARRP